MFHVGWDVLYSKYLAHNLGAGARSLRVGTWAAGQPIGGETGQKEGTWPKARRPKSLLAAQVLARLQLQSFGGREKTDDHCGAGDSVHPPSHSLEGKNKLHREGGGVAQKDLKMGKK